MKGKGKRSKRGRGGRGRGERESRREEETTQNPGDCTRKTLSKATHRENKKG